MNNRNKQDYIRLAYFSAQINLLLIFVKGIVGIFGNSYALVADAIESSGDLVASFVVYCGLKLATKPEDDNHQYGHGRFEPLLSVLLSGSMLLFAFGIAYVCLTSLGDETVDRPSYLAAAVVLVVIIVKEGMYRYVRARSKDSRLLQHEAMHHRSDALSSVITFLGIILSIFYENRLGDLLAGLVCAGFILVASLRIGYGALHELMDTRPDQDLFDRVTGIAMSVDGVLGTHKCRIRKSGLDYVIDLQILCDPELSIRQGHDIAHHVVEAISGHFSFKSYISVHVEPVDDFGRRGRID